MRGRRPCAPFHLFLDGGCLRQSGRHSRFGGCAHAADFALWLVEADDRNHAGDASRAHDLVHVVLRYFNVAGADPRGRTGQSSPKGYAPDQGCGRERRWDARKARRLWHRLSDPRWHLHSRLRPCQRSDPRACGRAAPLTFRRRLADAQLRLRSRLLGLEVIETVKRISGVDFKVEYAPRREGDPARIVAGSERIRSPLGWQPRLDDLSVIVAHVLDWEREFATRPPYCRARIKGSGARLVVEIDAR